MKKILSLIIVTLLLCSCSVAEPSQTNTTTQINNIVTTTQVVNNSTTTVTTTQINNTTTTQTNIPITSQNVTDALTYTPLSIAGFYVTCISPTQTLTSGNNTASFVIPSNVNNFNLVDVQVHIWTISSSGNVNINIYNSTDSALMTSTSYTVDIGEYDSSTANITGVINTSYDDVVTGDVIRIDVINAGTGVKGLDVILQFRKQ
jgi:hypothetical protein